MRLLGSVATGLALLVAGTSAAGAVPRCGSAAGDVATVAGMEGDIAAQCDCCGPPTTNGPCVLGRVKAALRAGSLSRICARKVLRDAIRACPLAGAGSLPCQVCNSDADCGAGEFCECRMASCNKTGGVCVARPDVCPEIAAPVCGCDGMTYANDCERQAAGACKRKNGSCVEAGGCLDTSTGQCTGDACTPQTPCTQPDQICSPTCMAPPPRGTCFDLLTRTCTGQKCGDDAPCLPKQACLPICPPPTPVGKCFVTVDGQCTDESCGPNQPCREPNEFCSPACLGSPGCTTDADCTDGNGCTADRCVNGACEHECLCVGPLGEMSCCPGPSALCVKPCGSDASGTCGGNCPAGASCTTLPDASSCGCVSQLGGPCGGNIFGAPPVCAPGLVCKQVNPDVTGICVEADPCSSNAACSGSCTLPCSDGTTATGSCLAAANGAAVCACSAQCNPAPTPTPGQCGDVANCAGTCPFVCPDGTQATGKCGIIVVDPPGKVGAPFGPMCRCFADCPEPPTPTPLPGSCGTSPKCGGPCPFLCSDGTAVEGQCLPVPTTDGDVMRPCACVATCGTPPPTPTPGPCDANNCGATCMADCPDGSTAEGKCVPIPSRGQLNPVIPGCVCIPECPQAPTPTPGPCEQSPNCTGTCPFTCPNGTTVIGKCLGARVGVSAPMHGFCGCLADCGSPPVPSSRGSTSRSAASAASRPASASTFTGLR